MHVTGLRMEHFRNITKSTLDLDRHLTLLVGDNGQGKTNLLEALYLALQGQDFRTLTERDVIQEGHEETFVVAEGVADGDRTWKWSHRVQRTPLRRGHQGVRVPVVLFAPEDVELAKGSPGLRRHFLDLLLGAYDGRYAKALRAFNRVLSQRNRALKDPNLHGVIDDFSALLVGSGFYLWQKRQELWQQLLPEAQRIHASLSHGERLDADYVWGGSDKPIESEEAFRAQLKWRRQDEMTRQVTLVGPQRDDIRFMINEKTALGFASQGQFRTLALSMKLATYEWLREATGIRPLILLDDVLSELDEGRRQEILARVSVQEQQTVITDTEPRSYHLSNPKIYLVVAGEVRPWQDPMTSTNFKPS